MMAEIFAIFVLMFAISAVTLAISPSWVPILAELVSMLTLNDWLIKGQLISKCLLGVIVSTKIPTKKFDKFCPSS